MTFSSIAYLSLTKILLFKYQGVLCLHTYLHYMLRTFLKRYSRQFMYIYEYIDIHYFNVYRQVSEVYRMTLTGL